VIILAASPLRSIPLNRTSLESPGAGILKWMLPRHEIEIRVRYQETDAQGRVHHANYFTYFEMGRVEQLRAAGLSYRKMEEEGVMLVVVEMAAKYRKGAMYDDLLRLETATVKARGVRIEHEYRVFRGDELLVEGRSTLACVDKSGRLRPLPEYLQD
jgi:acyl-CoA thioester hydrolase